jgi:hypothetical protein
VRFAPAKGEVAALVTASNCGRESLDRLARAFTDAPSIDIRPLNVESSSHSPMRPIESIHSSSDAHAETPMLLLIADTTTEGCNIASFRSSPQEYTSTPVTAHCANHQTTLISETLVAELSTCSDVLDRRERNDSEPNFDSARSPHAKRQRTPNHDLSCTVPHHLCTLARISLFHHAACCVKLNCAGRLSHADRSHAALTAPAALNP